MRPINVAFIIILGAALGALILGLCGRFAVAGVSLATGHDPNLSLTGILLVLLLGTILGSLGSLLIFPARVLFETTGKMCGASVGLTLFIITFLITLRRGGIDFNNPLVLLLTLGVTLIFFIIYGLTLNGMVSRIEGR